MSKDSNYLAKTVTIKVEDAACDACKATGLYVGFAEHDGAAVVCHKCKGTGKFPFEIKYTIFKRKKRKNKVKRIFQTNPGIGIGESKGLKLEDFGGMLYTKWLAGYSFPEKSEMRKFVCPAWWYQSVNYKLKPDWDECSGMGAFSDCTYFKNKDKCWERWDKEYSKKKK